MSVLNVAYYPPKKTIRLKEELRIKAPANTWKRIYLPYRSFICFIART